MDRTIVYSLEQIRSYDYLQTIKDALRGQSGIIRGLIGTYSPVFWGFDPTPSSPLSLTINVSEGWITAHTVTDATAYGALAADSSVITQQGYNPAQTITFEVSDLFETQSKWALVQIAYAQQDAIRSGDPNNGILPYINPDNPAQPFQGPGNNNTQQNTVRLSGVEVIVKYGAPAETGLHVPPSPDANFLPVFLVSLAWGQSTITSNQINLAGPDVYASYPYAPKFPGVTGFTDFNPTGSHHGGIPGQGSKIELAGDPLNGGLEVKGVAELINLPTCNSFPATQGTGNITVNPDIPIFAQSNGNPNGNVPGNQNQIVFDNVNNVLYICTVSGQASSAVWASVGSGGGGGGGGGGVEQIIAGTNITVAPSDGLGIVTVNASGGGGGSGGWPQHLVYVTGDTSVTAAGNLYFVDTAAGDVTMTLPAIASYGQTTPVGFINMGPNVVHIQPDTANSIGFGANNVPVHLQSGADVYRLAPSPKTSDTRWFGW